MTQLHTMAGGYAWRHARSTLGEQQCRARRAARALKPLTAAVHRRCSSASSALWYCTLARMQRVTPCLSVLPSCDHRSAIAARPATLMFFVCVFV